MPEIDSLSTGKKVGNVLDETLKIGGGATTATTPTTTIPREDASTATAPTLLRLQRTSTGTPANGIGAGIDFEVETAAGNNEIGAVIQAVTTDVTAASEDFDIVFKNMTAGAAATEKGRLTSLGVLNITGAFGGAPYPGYTLTTATGQVGSGTSGVKIFSNGFYIFDGSLAQFVIHNSLGIYAHGSRILGFTAAAADAAGPDAAFGRKAAGVTEANNGTKGSYTGSAFGSGSQTVAQLPAAATAGKGARSFVTDASATTFLSTVAGGGANNVPVVSDGTNWLIG